MYQAIYPFTEQIPTQGGGELSSDGGVPLIRRNRESFKTEFCKLHKNEKTSFFCEEKVMNLSGESFLFYLPKQQLSNILKILISSEIKEMIQHHLYLFKY